MNQASRHNTASKGYHAPFAHKNNKGPRRNRDGWTQRYMERCNQAGPCHRGPCGKGSQRLPRGPSHREPGMGDEAWTKMMS